MPFIQRFLRQRFQFLFNRAQQCLQSAWGSWENGIRHVEMLGRSAWHIYTAVEVVFTGVDPQTQGLMRLRRSTARFSVDLAIVFPNDSQKERKLLERLHKKSSNRPMKEINLIPSLEYEGYLRRIQDLHMVVLLLCQGYINRQSLPLNR